VFSLVNIALTTSDDSILEDFSSENLLFFWGAWSSFVSEFLDENIDSSVVLSYQ
jgi:hypothetical protein